MDIEPVRLLSMAKEAGDAFLKDGKALDETIASMADRSELNLHQISRVVEEANHYVQAELYKSSEDKTFTFDVADAQKIATRIKGKGMPKVALFDVLHAATPRPSANERTAFMQKVASVTSEKLDEAELREVDFYLRKLAQHVECFKEEFLIRRAAAQEDFEHRFEKLAQDAKDHIGLNGGSLSDMLKYACLLHPDFSDGYKVLFSGIRDVLEKLGTPVEKELICEGLEVPDGTLEVINGEHTLAVELDTIRNKISDDDRSARYIRLLDTFGDAVASRIRTLRTVEDMDKSVLEGAAVLNKKAEAGPDAFCEDMDKEAWKGKAIAAVLGALGLLAAGKAVKEGVKGAVKETGRTRDEAKQLAGLTHGGYQFAY